ncbi:MAG: helix-turn-helix transcriptional regulator [Mollicutes bacterium]|nr:helix-turn-helix transcriptional regulator [Mollicutes bacterium]
MKINEKIYSLRKKHNLSQEELANELNVSRQTVSKWELGESAPDIDKIIPLCELFNISTEELLRGKQSEDEKIIKGEYRPDIIKAILICVGIFCFFLAVISTIVLEEIIKIKNDGIIASTFILLSSIGIVILIFTFLTRKNLNKHIKENESSFEIKAVKQSNPILKTIKSIIFIITTIIYLAISFITMAWHITWIIWLIYSLLIEIVNLIFIIKRGEKNEE